MTLVSDIIKEAFEESGLLTDTEYPTRTQFDKALIRLQRIVDSVYDNEAGVKLTDWYLGNNGVYQAEPTFEFVRSEIYPYQNTRLVANNTSNITVYLPYKPNDGARIQIVDPKGTLGTYTVTLDGNGRSIENSATLAASTDGRTWFYRADQADWVRIAALTSSGDLPFPSQFDDYFIIALAKRLNPKYGSTSHIDSERRFLETRRKLQSQYAQSYQTPIDASLTGSFVRRNLDFYSGRP